MRRAWAGVGVGVFGAWSCGYVTNLWRSRVFRSIFARPGYLVWFGEVARNIPADVVVVFADTYVLRYFEDLYIVTRNKLLSWVIEALVYFTRL